MTERRLWVAALPERGGEVPLPEGSARHARVLRLAEGDPVILFDGEGREAPGRVRSIEDGALVCDAEAPREAGAVEPPLVLVLCSPKGDRLETAVRMATELGVTEIRLAVSERTVPRLDDRRAAAKVARLERLVREAARQSERVRVPRLVPPTSLAAAAAGVPEGLARVVFFARSHTPLHQVLPEGAPGAAVIVGPEGGLAAAEVEALRQVGWLDATLGPSILRVDTAVAAALALVRHRLFR